MVSFSISINGNNFGIIIITFFVGCLIFYGGLYAIKWKRLLENTPTSKIRSIALGPVEIKGKAKTLTPFVAPISGKKCVYLIYNIEEYRKSGKSGSFVTIKTEAFGNSFYVEDDTGKVEVDTKKALIEIPSKTWEINSFKKNDVVSAFIEKNGFSTTSLGLRKNMRVVEKLIEIDQEIYVFGNAENNPKVEDGTTVRNEDDIVIKKARGYPFYISYRTEKDILKRFKWQIPAQLIIGIALILASIGILLNTIA